MDAALDPGEHGVGAVLQAHVAPVVAARRRAFFIRDFRMAREGWKAELFRS